MCTVGAAALSMPINGAGQDTLAIRSSAGPAGQVRRPRHGLITPGLGLGAAACVTARQVVQAWPCTLDPRPTAYPPKHSRRWFSCSSAAAPVAICNRCCRHGLTTCPEARALMPQPLRRCGALLLQQAKTCSRCRRRVGRYCPPLVQRSHHYRQQYDIAQDAPWGSTLLQESTPGLVQRCAAATAAAAGTAAPRHDLP